MLPHWHPSRGGELCINSAIIDIYKKLKNRSNKKHKQPPTLLDEIKAITASIIELRKSDERKIKEHEKKAE